MRQNYYSVPARYAGRRLAVRLSARPSRSSTGRRSSPAHERAAGRYVEVLTLDHYLEVLKNKPGALPGATALAQARAAGAFTATHQRYWDAARRARGDAAGTRALIEVLLAHRTLPAAALTAAMDRAVASGVLDPQVVLIDARRLAGGPSRRSSRSARWPATTGPPRPWPATTNCSPGAPDDRACPTPPPRPPSAPPPASCTCPPSAPKPPGWPRSPSGNATPTWATSPRVLAAEVDDRTSRRRTRRIAEARFPRLKRLADFNTDAVPTIAPAQLATLATGA